MKGVILAAGEGSRIRDVTYGAIPKELLPIGNVPTIRFPIESLKLAGIKDILIVVSPNGKHNLLQGLRNGKQFGVNLCYVVQEIGKKEERGIGKAILSTENWINQEDFLVACGDTILCNFSSKNPFNCLESFLKVHMANDPLATIFLYPTNLDPTRFGVAKFKELKNKAGAYYGELEKLVEKPSLEVSKSYRSNGFYHIVTGYYLLKPGIFSYIKRTKPGVKNEVQITDSLALAIENGEKILGVIHGGRHGNQMFPYEYWDVGVPEIYKEANRKLIDMSIEDLLS